MLEHVEPDVNYKDSIPPDLKEVSEKLVKKPVILAMMSRGNDIYYNTMFYVLHQKQIFEKMGLVVAVKSFGGAVELMYGMCFKQPAEFYHIMDSDVAPAKDTTLRLMAHDLDIVTSPLWFYDGCSSSLHLDIHYTDDCLREYTPKLPEEGLEKIFATSFGSVLIKRRVIEMFVQSGETFGTWSNLIDEKLKKATPDTIFFAKANAFGFDVYVDWACEVGTHHKYVELCSPVVETFVAQRMFDLKYGASRKRELLSTHQGRTVLANDLKRGFDLKQSGRHDLQRACAMVSSTGEDDVNGET